MCRWDCFVISLELCIPKVIEELKIKFFLNFNFLFKSLILCKKLVHFWPLYVPVLLCGNLLLVRTEKYNFWTQLFLILSLIEIRKNYSWNGQRSSNCLKHVRFPEILLLSRICYPNPLYPTRWNLHFLSRRIISKHFFWHINRQSRSWWNYFKHFFTWNFHFHFEKLHADDMLFEQHVRVILKMLSYVLVVHLKDYFREIGSYRIICPPKLQKIVFFSLFFKFKWR